MESLKEIMKIQMKRNEWSRKDLDPVFFLAQHLKITKQHQTTPNWIEFIFLFHQPIQSSNLIYYPLYESLFWCFVGYPFPDWFGGWNQQFLNKGFKKEKIRNILEIQENHQDPNGGNESSRKELNLFFLAKHLKIIKQHQLIINIESNWIEFIFLFHHPIQSPNFIYYPLY